MRYIDVHSHIQFSDYDADRADVLARMRELGVGAIVVGCDLEGSRRAVDLASKEPDIWATIGVHPTDKRDEGFNPVEYEKLLNERVVAVGECGLDYYRKDGTNDAEISRQKALFQAQVQFALAHDLPLMIHCRPSKGTITVYEDLIAILKPIKVEYGEKLRGNIHFFEGNIHIANEFIELGFTLSFTGVITFAREYDDVVRGIPSTSILSETDSPYVTPVPHRGERNESSLVVEVVKKITEIRGRESFELVEKTILENAHRMFGVS